MNDMDEIIGEFVVECLEGLDRLDGELVALESDPKDQEVLSSIFRTIHSIKGASGFLEFSRLEKLTHAGENLLDAVRSEQLAMNQDIATALLELNDRVREILTLIEESGSDEGATDPSFGALTDKLTALLAEDAGAPSKGSGGSTAKKKAARKKRAPRKKAAASEPEAPAETASGPDADAPAPVETARQRPPSGAGTAPAAAEGNIRVRVDHLDALMNLAGELVLSRNQIVQHATRSEDTTAHASAQRLNHITTELQERIMKIRMQPIGLLFSKFPRIVRDLAGHLGKSVSLDLIGAETELDKTLLEAIKDPLTHLVRNSLDHGIETPDERVAAGKDPASTLTLSAAHESGQVVIAITDDGRGIDAERIKAKAVEKGIVAPSEAVQMDEREALELLFAPGFSTAETVTKVSGRGVGMDVVRRNLERVGGTVTIETSLGAGTTVKVRIPLTLAIIPALTIKAGGDRYAIPQANLVELVRVNARAHAGGEDTRDRIEWLHGKPVFRLRERLLPVLDLNAELGISSPETGATGQAIVVVNDGTRRLGLLVDEILETEEIVVKPLDRHVKALGAYAGTTILGDGRVALILDVAGIAARGSLVAEKDLEAETPPGDAPGPSGSSMVIVSVGGGRRMGIPLSEVARLEEFRSDDIERMGIHQVIQYRGGIMPLLDLGARFPAAHPVEPASAMAGVTRAIVHSGAAGDIGLVVDDVLDVVEVEDDAPVQPSTEAGVRHAIVAGGAITEILDPDGIGGPPPVSADAAAAPAGTSAEPGGAHGRSVSAPVQICSFRLDGALYGIDVLDVQEVLPPQPRTPIPLSAGDIVGLINLRGETVVLIDLARRLGITTAQPDGAAVSNEDKMHVVLRSKGGTFSVLVDEIGEVLELDPRAFEPCPASFDEEARAFARGVHKVEGELLLQLDVAAIGAGVGAAASTSNDESNDTSES